MSVASTLLVLTMVVLFGLQTGTIDQIRFLASDMAVVDGSWTVTHSHELMFSDETREFQTRARITFSASVRT